MSLIYGPRITTDQLYWCVDAGNPQSYPGTGNLLFDLVEPNYTQGYSLIKQSNVVWNGLGYLEFPNVVNSGIHYYAEALNGNANNIMQRYAENYEWSIEAWVRVNGYGTTSPAPSPNGENFIIGKTGWHGGIMQWMDGSINFRLHGVNAGEIQDCTFNTTFGDWNHVVAVYNNRQMKSYTNGVLQDTQVFYAPWLLLYTSQLFRIGGYNSNNYRLNGDIGAIRLYTKELSPTEILNNFNASGSKYGVI